MKHLALARSDTEAVWTQGRTSAHACTTHCASHGAMITDSSTRRKVSGVARLPENELFLKSACFQVQNTAESTAHFILHIPNRELKATGNFALKFVVVVVLSPATVCVTNCASLKREASKWHLHGSLKWNNSSKKHSWEAKRTSATIFYVKLIKLLVFLKKLSSAFGGQFPGNFNGNFFLENVLNQRVLQPMRSPVASASSSYLCRSECNRHAWSHTFSLTRTQTCVFSSWFLTDFILIWK